MKINEGYKEKGKGRKCNETNEEKDSRMVDDSRTGAQCGDSACAGEGGRGGCGNICKFTISQKIKVEIPVIFGAKAEVGAAAIDCEGVGVDKHEANCCK